MQGTKEELLEFIEASKDLYRNIQKTPAKVIIEKDDSGNIKTEFEGNMIAIIVALELAKKSVMKEANLSQNHIDVLNSFIDYQIREEKYNKGKQIISNNK